MTFSGYDGFGLIFFSVLVQRKLDKPDYDYSIILPFSKSPINIKIDLSYFYLDLATGGALGY
jgi:hypothetical protein